MFSFYCCLALHPHVIWLLADLTKANQLTNCMCVCVPFAKSGRLSIVFLLLVVGVLFRNLSGLTGLVAYYFFAPPFFVCKRKNCHCHRLAGQQNSPYQMVTMLTNFEVKNSAYYFLKIFLFSILLFLFFQRCFSI